MSVLDQGFQDFQIGAEELQPGEFEVGFLIPRDAVSNDLERLGDEFTKLNSILAPFLELATGTRPDLKVRSIASSEFAVYLIAVPGLALTLAKAVESLLASYEKIKAIRAKVAELQDEAQVPDTVTAPLLDHANERMEADIESLTSELMASAMAQLPPGRRYELHMDVRHSLRQLAKRIDEGYSIDVRAYVVGEGDAAAGQSDETVLAARSIASSQPGMRRMNLTGRPILTIADGDDFGWAPTGDPPRTEIAGEPALDEAAAGDSATGLEPPGSTD